MTTNVTVKATQYFAVGSPACLALDDPVAAGMSPKRPNSRVMTIVNATVGTG